MERVINDRALNMAEYISFVIDDYAWTFLESSGKSVKKISEILEPIKSGRLAEILAEKLTEKFNDKASWSRGELKIPVIGNGSQYHRKDLSMIANALRECGIDESQIGLSSLPGFLFCISAQSDRYGFEMLLEAYGYDADMKDYTIHTLHRCQFEVPEMPNHPTRIDESLFSKVPLYVDGKHQYVGDVRYITDDIVERSKGYSRDYVGSVLENLDSLKRQLAKAEEERDALREQVSAPDANGKSAAENAEALRNANYLIAKIKEQIDYAEQIEQNFSEESSEPGEN